jgi:thioredoxin-like negative regulator of GroEL
MDDTGTNNSDNQPNLEQLMQMGIQTARAGNKANARMMFQQVLEQDAENERAWLWMAAVAATPTDRIRYLNAVLHINPNNQRAQSELEKMKQRKETSNTKVIRYGFIGLGIMLVLIVCVVVALLVL